MYNKSYFRYNGKKEEKMNQEQIGKFIATCRKKKNLTQLELAEKLGITDRAVSKWERGLNLPDASLIKELCSILSISINELFSGEFITDENYMKKAEGNLVDLKRREEEQNKLLFLLELVIGLSCTISFITLILIACFANFTLLGKGVVIGISLLIFATGIFFSLKIEREVGFYECHNCHHKYIPKLLPFFFSMNFLRRRYLKCPYCHKKSWNKKVAS